MPDEKFHPFIFYWIAFYDNGTCLPQFDPENGKVNDIKMVDQSKLIKFGLFPFNVPIAIKASMVAGFKIAEVKESLPYFILNIEKGQKVIYWRRDFIDIFEYDQCDSCGYKWVWSPPTLPKDGMIGEVGLPLHSNRVLQTWKEKEYPCCQCPKCGVFNAIICPDCKDVLINELRRENGERYFQCPKCKKEFPRHIKLYSDILRRSIYLLGHRTTIDGKDKDQIMFISEDGNIWMNDNFNYK